MTAAHGFKLTGGASLAHTKITSNGISQYDGVESSAAEGFTIGADTGLNVSGETIVYVAIRNQ